MKKTLVALAVAATTLVATSANAAVIYKDDATKVELKGSLRLALGKFGNNQRGDLINNGSRLFINAEHNLGDGLSAIVGSQFRFNGNTSGNETFGDPTVRNLYAGFKYAPVGTLTFGKQPTNLDDFDTVDYSNVFGGNDGDNLDSVTTAKSVKFRSVDVNGFSLGLDYLFGNSDKKATSSALKYGYAASIFYNGDLAEGLKLNSGVAFGETHYDNVTDTSKTDSKNQFWRALAELEFGPASFGVEYGQIYNKDTQNGQHTTTSKGHYLEVGAKYKVAEPTTLYAQWQRNEVRTTKLGQVYIAGVQYNFNKNVYTYVEYAHDRTKTYNTNAAPTKSTDNKYAVGLRVNF